MSGASAPVSAAPSAPAVAGAVERGRTGARDRNAAAGRPSPSPRSSRHSGRNRSMAREHGTTPRRSAGPRTERRRRQADGRASVIPLLGPAPGGGGVARRRPGLGAGGIRRRGCRAATAGPRAHRTPRLHPLRVTPPSKRPCAVPAPGIRAPLSPHAAATAPAETDPSGPATTTPTDAGPPTTARRRRRRRRGRPAHRIPGSRRRRAGRRRERCDAARAPPPPPQRPGLPLRSRAADADRCRCGPRLARPRRPPRLMPRRPPPRRRRLCDPSPTPTPVPHLLNESPLAPSDASARRWPRCRVRVRPPHPPPRPPPQQAASSLDVDGLSGSISRPLSDGNGTYTVTVALHPPELGHVQAVMSLDGNDLSVSLTRADPDRARRAGQCGRRPEEPAGPRRGQCERHPARPRVPGGAEERYRPSTTSGHGPFITESTATESPLPSGLVAGQIHLVL